MKKKTLVAVLVILIVVLAAALLLMQGRGKQQTQAPQTPPAQAAAPELPQTQSTPAVITEEELTVNTDAQETADAMQSVIEAAACAMYDAQTGFLDMEDASLCWKTLALLCSSKALPEGITEDMGDGTMKISSENMAALAKSCFASREDLPELPKDMDTVSFDKDGDFYIVKKNEDQELRCEIMETTPNADGGYSASAALLRSGNGEIPLVSTYAFDIMPYFNVQSGEIQSAEDAAQAVFPMCMLGAYDTCNVLAQITGIEEKDEEILLNVHHVQLHWENDAESGDEEAYVPVIVADTKADETLKLLSVDAADWNGIAKVIGDDEQSFESAEEAWAWYKKNYDKKVENENIMLQMRVYDHTIYSMAPLYSFYFAG